MKLKEWLDGLLKQKPEIIIKDSNLLQKLHEIDSLSNYFVLMYGVELDIRVKPKEFEQNNFFDKGMIESLKPFNN